MFARMKMLIMVISLSATCSVVTGQIIRGSGLPGFYDASSGNFTVDMTGVTGGVFGGYGFTGNLCCSPGLRFENHTPFMGTSFVTSEEDLITESNFAGVPGGVYSFGDVLPVGLSADELSTMYFGLDRHGNGGGPLDGTKYYVLGPIGTNVFHLIEPIYSPSPFPALNDGIGGTEVPSNWAKQVSLLYDAQSGGLSIDLSGEQGGSIWAYEIFLQEETASFSVDEFTPTTENPFTSSAEEFRIGEFGISGIAPGLYDLGRLLPAGMSEVELSSAISNARFVGEPGHDVGSFDIGLSGADMAIRFAIPEPSGVFMLIVGVACLVARRSNAAR